MSAQKAKAVCPTCGREVAVNLDGVFRWHNETVGGRLCANSRVLVIRSDKEQ